MEFSDIIKEIGLSNEEILFLYDELPLWSAPFGFKLLDVIEYKKHLRVLDIGSGAGFPLIEIAQRLGSTSEVYGIDPWQPGVDKIKSKIKLLNLENANIVKGVAESLPFDSEYFNLIVSNNGINNVDDTEKALDESRRVSKKNAQFVMTVNLPGTMIEFYKVFTESLLELGLNELIPEIQKHIKVKRKSASENINLIENSGFEITNLYEDSFHYKFTDGESFMKYFLIRLGFLPSWKEIVNDRHEEVFNLVQKKLDKIAGMNGNIVLSVPYICIDSRAV